MERTMHPYADERLILQTGQGDIAALQRLFEQVYDAVYCYALSIVCDDWTAKTLRKRPFWQCGSMQEIIMWKPMMLFPGF